MNGEPLQRQPMPAQATQQSREYWETHYRSLFARGPTWLDYSNEQVQLTTFGLCLDASGAVAQRDCLDLGCGRGQFARLLATAGARVTAVDLLEDVLAERRALLPEITWRAGNLLDSAFVDALGVFDRVFLLEVLQCVPWLEVLRAVWAHVVPGGRLIAMVPCGDCPIVQRVIARHAGVFSAPTHTELLAALGQLPDAEHWSSRGLTFADDQSLAPYTVSMWTQKPSWAAPPNRLQFVLEKRSARRQAK
jgi:2-polyprenyl-3-methyl-5-hydroxy-6-metoxy-1,4-benzoquinol methylase